MRLALPVSTLLSLCWVGVAPAQIILVPVPFESGSFYGKGFGVSYKKRNLTISAYVASSGYAISGFAPYVALPPPYYPPPYYLAQPPLVGPANGRASLAYNAPVPARPAWRSEIEGIDLDKVPPREEPLPPQAEKKVELPGVDVSKPRPPQRPRDDEPNVNPPPPPRQPAPPEPAPPKDNPKDAGAHLLELGLAAFAAGAYGVAAHRLRQATEAQPKVALAHFILAEAQFALGKYDDAVLAIQAGMRLHKNWPDVAFHPRVDLYKGNELDYLAHLRRLEQALAKDAAADLVFLYAYELWFDGRRVEAMPLFRQARLMTADTTFIDRFLAAAPPGPVVQK